MATSLHLVRRNFTYQIESLTPTCTTVERPFLGLDRVRALQPGDSSGQARDFIVKRLQASGEIEPTDKAMRVALHEYELRIYYPQAIGLETDLDDVIEQDRHDVIERLRDSVYYVGISATSPTQYVGLQHRYRLYDEVDDSEDVWVAIYRWQCQIWEACS